MRLQVHLAMILIFSFATALIVIGTAEAGTTGCTISMNLYKKNGAQLTSTTVNIAFYHPAGSSTPCKTDTSTTGRYDLTNFTPTGGWNATDKTFKIVFSSSLGNPQTIK